MPFLAYVYFVSMCKLKPVPNLRFYFCLFEFKRHRPGLAKNCLTSCSLLGPVWFENVKVVPSSVFSKLMTPTPQLDNKYSNPKECL